MKIQLSRLGALLIMLVLVSCTFWNGRSTAGPASSPPPPTRPLAIVTESPHATNTATPPLAGPTPGPGTKPTAAAPGADPFDLVSQDSLLATLVDLTAIQPYSGWRTSASEGEREALDYVAGRLAELGYLQELGLEIERQSFQVPIGAELWESRLEIRLGGQEIEVPASALRGHRDDLALALNFDSDGALNDGERQPVVVDGPVVVIRSESELESARTADISGRIVLLDYAVVDRVIAGSQRAVALANELLAKTPAGVVMVTQNSNVVGVSHGFGAGDLSAFTWAQLPKGADERIPILLARIEDLAPAGIQDWEAMSRIESARLTWDADISSPATSGNLAARIPGADPSRALILGAHIDSPNNPGAMDDGSGVAVLLEVTRVLDAARYQPAVDVILVWFGSEELGLYGSSYFAATHSELLDRAIAMLEIDDLTRPLDGIDAELSLIAWPYGRLGDDRLLWPDALQEAAAGRGVETVAASVYVPYSDNTPFAGYDVPNADLIYLNEAEMEAAGGLHYAAHIHDPYDTVETAREVAGVLEDMARLALSAVVDVDPDIRFRVVPVPDRRAVLVGSHTEAVHMTPSALTDFGMALSMEGYDVDLVPPGQAVTAADLDDANLVVVLPVIDYPPVADDPGTYDEAWTQAEIDVLEQYVASGGFLVLTNSANRLKYMNQIGDPNEDAADMNDLAGRFGITFGTHLLTAGSVSVEADSPLLEGVSSLAMAAGNGLAIDLDGGQVLARDGRRVAAALVDHGGAGGQVLVLADVGMLGSSGGPELVNLRFWQNLAAYARAR